LAHVAKLAKRQQKKPQKLPTQPAKLLKQAPTMPWKLLKALLTQLPPLLAMLLTQPLTLPRTQPQPLALLLKKLVRT
jgi:hypothetical protein